MKAIILINESSEQTKGKKSIVDHKILGNTVLSYVVDAARQLGCDDIVTVPEQTAADQYIQGDGVILVLQGNMPLVTKETLQDLFITHNARKNTVTVLQNEEKPVGIYLFHAPSLKNTNTQNQFHLSHLLEHLREQGLRISSFISENKEEFLTVNTKCQLHDAAQIIKTRINRSHMENGVTIIDSSQTFIGPHIVIGEDTVIYPGTILEGAAKIGADCIIGPNSRIIDSTVGDNVEIQYSVVLEAVIGSKTDVGPFAYIRPHSNIGENCKVGDFVEVKNSTIGDNTKASHLTYIGDSDVGSHINFGCGTVTVNYDGRNKYRTVIKDHVFVGCNTNLVAPVTVEEGAFIAAGSTITDDVPTKNLAIAGTRQINKTNWKKK